MGETNNKGYIAAQAYATNPTGEAPTENYHEYERGIDAYALEQAGKAALLSASIDVLSGAPTPSATINANGHILVGKTTSGLADPGFEARQNGQILGAVDGAGILFLNRITDDGLLASFQQDGSAKGSISISGSTTAYNTSSDYRLKENIEDLTGATDRLNQIPVKRFNFKSSPDKTVDGFLAHEVQAVVPEAVQGEKDGEDYQQIDQSKLVPLLVATIQELEARITALEA